MKKKIVVGATGASGIPLLIKCLELIKENPDYESHLVMSRGAEITLEHETDIKIENVYAMADYTYDILATGAKLASGSFNTDGMLVVPCSMKTLAGIHSGYADNLLLRAADVTLKELRPLVLAVRETPLSSIHLRNMYEMSMIQGVRIIPPMPAYYIKPKSIEEITYHSASKLLEPFGLEAPSYKRWNGI